MKENLGAPALPSGSRASHEAPTGLHPSGFDPSRVRAMQRNLVIYAVTGGRDYINRVHVFDILDEEFSFLHGHALAQGECPTGADKLARDWCEHRGVPCIGIKAQWNHYGKAAGPIRNSWIFQLLPIFKLLAFPGDRGTADCVERARNLDILVRDLRDSDGSPKGTDPKGLDGVAATARA